VSIRVSMTAPQFAPSIDPVLEAAALAEQAGLDGMFAFDHLIPLGDPSRPVLELAATLGAVASATSRLLVGSLVARAPLRGPAVTTAVARTLQAIAPGRVILGLGSGDSHSRPEVERFGQVYDDLDRRVGMVEETVLALTGTGVTCWVGGTHPRILDVALQSDGWNGWSLPLDVFADKVAVLRARRPDLTMSWGGSVVVGRDPDEVERLVAARGGALGDVNGTCEQVVGQLMRHVEAGADHLVVSILPNRPDRWELFLAEVLPRLRDP
jgi:alkanesulfonate monooxygenase SsuD/methylene tetrahydromethanopterin reductase-like flavin-dependent oxidoreductase (luciferase family)